MTTKTTTKRLINGLTPAQNRVRNNAIVRACRKGGRGSMTRVAAQYGLTRARVSQIVAQGLAS